MLDDENEVDDHLVDDRRTQALETLEALEVQVREDKEVKEVDKRCKFNTFITYPNPLSRI